MNVYSIPLEMSTKRRTPVAEAAVREAFRGRALSLAREPDFIDHAPPRHREVATLKGAYENA